MTSINVKKFDDLVQYVNLNFPYHNKETAAPKNGHIVYLLFRYKRDKHAIADYIRASPTHSHLSANALRTTLHRLLQTVNNKRKQLTREWDSLIIFLNAPFRFPQKRELTQYAALNQDNESDESTSSGLIEHTGGCYCEAVRFKVVAPARLVVQECSCSMCTKKRNLYFIVPKGNFTLLQGEDNITTYIKIPAKHTFCKTCGVQSFFTPHSDSEGYGVMPHCLDKGTVKRVTAKKFGGIKCDKTESKDISRSKRQAQQADNI